MSPEQKQIKELEKQVKYLQQQMREFTNAAQIDPQIIRALGTAFIAPSGKTALSATQDVDEAGTNTWQLMKKPDGFIRIGDYNIPYII